jgi:ribosome maturation factor RimP
MTQVQDIWSVIEPYLVAERLELDDLEFNGLGRGRVLRVTVDGDDVNIDRLADVSHGLSRLLDNETDLDGQYQLEVSSPGLERKLRRPEHYIKSVGRQVVAKVGNGDAKTTLRGTITSADGAGFSLDGGETVAYSDVVTAKTVFTWEKAPKPGH